MDKQREEFEELIAAHVAQLGDVNAKYSGKLIPGQRDLFLKKVLELAGNTFETFNPEKLELRMWWDERCRLVALSRETWTVETITGLKIVKGKHLHLWGLGKNGDWYT